MATASGRVYVTESGEAIHGILASFATPADLYHAAEKVRDQGYSRWDTFTPFPIHGLEEAMGMRRTKLPVLVACIGLSGSGLGFLMQWWMSMYGYALVTQGKPFNSWQAFVPITFELGILFSAFTALIGMLALNGLPRHHHPLFRKERFLASSDDGFFVCVEASDPRFDPDRTRSLLEHAGATSIELVEE
ncbi:MAG: DUF3341 domain-containing protein [Planctomycetota bacterium]|nr:DUF3341 domain-containing protein [Planctomycetota bacterium]